MNDPADGTGWEAEAAAVIEDIKCHVTTVAVSTLLPNSNHKIHLNIVTLEGSAVCVELTSSGFRIAGLATDTSNLENGTVFETPYTLLESISAKFRDSFGAQLIKKLTRLKEDQEAI